MRGSSVSFVPVKKIPESGHWSHYLQLLSHLWSFCTAISPSNPPSSLLFDAGARWESFQSFMTCRRKCRVCCLILTPTFERFELCHEPPFTAGSGQALVSLSQLCLSNPETPIMLYSERGNAHTRFVAPRQDIHLVLQTYMYCLFCPEQSSGHAVTIGYVSYHSTKA